MSILSTTVSGIATVTTSTAATPTITGDAAFLPLFVVIPLAAAAVAAIAALWRGILLQRLLALVIPALSGLGGVALLLEHSVTPVLATQVGGFIPGVAIPFVSDTLAAAMLAVTGLTSWACLVFAARTEEDRLRFFPALTLMLTAGVNGALLTGDLFNLFVFVEVMLLPSYALIAMTGTWRRLAVGRLFIVINLLTSSVFLIGLALLYGGAGAVNIAVLAGAAADNPTIAFGAAVILLALLIKAGAVPMHGWLPAAYPSTSAAVMALFAGLHTKVALYAVYRIYSVVYDGTPTWLPVLIALALATILVGSWASMGESTMRRNLAYQMVAGVGFILLGVAISTRDAMAGGLFYLVHHIVTMGALLLAAGAVEQTYGSGHLVRLAQLLRRERMLSWIVALGLLSLVGMPPSSGFWGKVALVRAAADADPVISWVAIGAVVAGSILSLVAMQRLWREIFWGPEMTVYRRKGAGKPVPLPDDLRIPRHLLVPATALVVASLLMFVFAGPLMEVAVTAAAGLEDPTAYVKAVLP